MLVGTFFAQPVVEVPTMRTTNRGIVAMLGSFAFAAVITVTPAFAGQDQAPAAAAQAQAPKSETAKGELRSIDVTKKTLTISEGDKQQIFTYTDTTKVSGAQGGIEGLASMSGRQVTVQYTMKGADRVASSIEVAAK
jgi:Cu/Ag efflux protein CusF